MVLVDSDRGGSLKEGSNGGTRILKTGFRSGQDHVLYQATLFKVLPCIHASPVVLLNNDHIFNCSPRRRAELVPLSHSGFKGIRFATLQITVAAAETVPLPLALGWK